MSKLLQLRGGTTAEHASFTGAVREVTVDTDKDTLVIHDGSTAGGFALPRTDAEIRTSVEAATDSNVFTDADHSKLNAIEASATADQTDAEIRTAVEAATDSNVFTDADHTKLNAIEAAATADQTKADIDALNINADLLDGQHGAYYTGYTDTAVAGIVDSSPAALNTLNELAAALGDDANFATTTANSIGTKMPLAGGTFTGAVNFTVDSNFTDGDKLTFGSSNDLQLYHDGSNSYISDVGTGNLVVAATNFYVNSAAGENYINCTADGAVNLYHNNILKLASNSGGIQVSGTINGGDLRGMAWKVGRDNNDNIQVGTTSIDFTLDGAVDMRLENDGDLHVEGNVIAYSTTISDERLKTDIVKIDGALDKVAQLNGYTFTYTADGKKSAGVIAQEVQKVLPSAIVESTLPLKMGDDDETEYMTVQYDQLMGLMIEAIKELKAEVAELKGK